MACGKRRRLRRLDQRRHQELAPTRCTAMRSRSANRASSTRRRSWRRACASGSGLRRYRAGAAIGGRSRGIARSTMPQSNAKARDDRTASNISPAAASAINRCARRRIIARGSVHVAHHRSVPRCAAVQRRPAVKVSHALDDRGLLVAGARRESERRGSRRFQREWPVRSQCPGQRHHA